MEVHENGGGIKMIVFYKLGNILKERNMTWKDLCEAGISQNTPQNFSKNRNVSSDTIGKVCKYLDVQPGDIMEYIDENKAKEAEILAQMEALKKQLEEVRSNK